MQAGVVHLGLFFWHWKALGNVLSTRRGLLAELLASLDGQMGRGLHISLPPSKNIK